MNKRSAPFLFFAFLILPLFGFSQGEFNNWYFGWDPKVISFNSGFPVLLSGNAMGSAVSINVSDSTGNILFYSNGVEVYNRNNLIMPHGNNLYGEFGSFIQAVTVVKKINDDSTYFLFTNGYYNPSGQCNPPSYSILNMKLDGTLGDVDPAHKNVPLLGGQKGWRAVTGSRAKNNRDAWVVLRLMDPDSNYFATYHITAAGLDPLPVFSPSLVSVPTSGNPWMPINKELKFSPDGTKLFSLYWGDTLEVCDFNGETGQVTPVFKVKPKYNHTPIGNCNQIEFSINSKLLYLTSEWPFRVYQFDATVTDTFAFNQSSIKVGTLLSTAGIQMAPDWKIYGSHNVFDSLWIINFPSVKGTACGFQRAGFYLGDPSWVDGLPQFVQRYKAYIHHSGSCVGKDIFFYGDIWPPADSIHWDFGDPPSGNNNYSNLPGPSHIYTDTGFYIVELFVRHNDNRTDTSWQVIHIVSSLKPNLGPDRIVCIGDSTTFDAGVCPGCLFQWIDLTTNQIVGTNQTFTTHLAGSYQVIRTDTLGCTGSDTVQLSTTPPPSLTNNPLSKSICTGESTNITLTSNLPGTNYHWTVTLSSGNITGFNPDSGLVINQILINAGAAPGVVTYHIIPEVGNCAGSVVDFAVTVTPGDSVKISISASANNICSGTPVTFMASPTNGGATPSYQWKVNGINVGPNNFSYTYNPASGDLVSCILTSSILVCISNNPAISNTIQMIVNPLNPVSVTISPSANPVCLGATVTYTAIPVNGGTISVFQWKVNGVIVGTNNPIYSYTPNNGDVINCILTSNILCPTGNPATSNIVTMTVNPNLPVSISISASANPFCQGSSVTFTAIPTNGGINPGYQWKVNGINAGTNNPVYSYSPNNGDVVSCVLTSNIACPVGNPATSNLITMIVNLNLPAGISISPSANPFCPGNAVTFTATPINGGVLPTYQWKVNGINAGINSSTYTYNPSSGDLVSCILTSNLACVTGNPATSNTIIMDGSLAPIVTFTRCFDSITTTSAKPFKLKGGIPLGGTYSGAGVNSVTGIFNPALAGVGVHPITYTYTNAALCSAHAIVPIVTIVPVVTICGQILTDIRDGKTYQTIQIGGQCWLAEDLNYGIEIPDNIDQRDNCIAEKYHNPASSIEHPASVYQWDEIMNYGISLANQGLCPPAWHVPSETDWNTLFANYTNNGFAGSPLKYSGYSGFNALLSGAYHMNKTWDWQGFGTFFWSSTTQGTLKAWSHGMNDIDPSVSFYPAFRSNAFSVRCLKD